MRTVIFLILCLGAGSFTRAHSQLVVPPASAQGGAIQNATAKSVSDLAKALKNDTYNKSAAKEKTALLARLPGLTTVPEAGAALASLSRMIKPAKFRSGFRWNEFAKKAASAATPLQANALLRELEAGLIPEAFNPIWKMQRASWLNDIK